ncbi:hypothetical protein SDC9_74405 [bioreactor metagenome]|uniref:DUF8156 domain-containing protein n=1 Tax=bioreactor metagenome TaxID=1076179 RepID=A0A644YHF6_9ZZZZ
MGRTIVSATQTWIEEDKALKRFERALRKKDQVLINELMALAHTHIAEASYASNLYPMDVYLISMLLELYKKLKRLEVQLQKNGVLADDELTQMRGITSLLELAGIDEPEPAEDQHFDDGTEYIDLEEGA